MSIWTSQCHVWISLGTYEWAFHIWISHVSRMNASCHAEEYVTYSDVTGSVTMCQALVTWVTNKSARYSIYYHTWMSHVTYMSRVMYEWVMSYVNESIPCMNEACHVLMTHVTQQRIRVNKSRHTREWSWYTLEFSCYGVATISRLLKILGLFCKRAPWKRLWSATETYNFKESTKRDHPIYTWMSHITYE